MQKDGFIGSIDAFKEYRPDELDLTRWTRCNELLADLNIYDKIKVVKELGVDIPPADRAPDNDTYECF